jgi:hypothetical protein
MRSACVRARPRRGRAVCGACRRRRSLLIAAPLALIVTMPAACGGGNQQQAYQRQLASSIAASYAADARARAAAPTAPVEEAYLSRADGLCAPVVAYNAAHPFPYPSFDPQHPDAATLPEVGAFFAASPYTRALNGLLALPLPRQHPQSWQAFRAGLGGLRQEELAQIAAADGRNAVAFLETLTPLQALGQQAADEAHQVGFTASEACGQLFASG